MMLSLLFGLVVFMVLIMIGDAVPESIANGKPTSQSTLFLDGVSARAVDGNTDGNYDEGNSCTSTTRGTSSWWAVDLQELYEVTSIKIYNRKDCCGERLQNFDIMVGNNPSNPAAMELCHHQQSPVGPMLEISCTNPIQGRHVLIRLLTSGVMLVLCEVEVFGDPISIAKGKYTAQSTVMAGGVSARAVDGNTDGNWYGNSCTATDGPVSWWAVDLDVVYEVTRVKIYNRQDCCGERLQNFDIVIGNDPSDPASMELCHHQQSSVGPMLDISCTHPIKGRIVMIMLVSGDVLTLCEVEVFGDAVPDSIANGKFTAQSTVIAGGVSERAVDGNTDGNWDGNSCTQTNGPDSWWAVGLDGFYNVIGVKIYNRQDCCGELLQNFDISVGINPLDPASMELCHHQQSAVGAMLEISCTHPIKGQAVLITLLSGDVLTLCEVEVFGDPSP